MFLLNTFDQIQELPAYVVALLFFTPLVGGIIIYFYKTRHARTWRKGIFPKKLKFTQDNLLEAYLALGARLILFDYQRGRNKTQFINQYFNRYFKSANYNFGDSLLFSMKHPIKIETVCSWLKENLHDEGARAQVIYFLTGLTLINGKLNPPELSFLKTINTQLGLSESNLKRIIAIYQSYYEAKDQEDNKSQSKERTASKMEQFRTILGVSRNAELTEIKKAYRKLVKIHHPDVFVDASDAQKRMAEEKFIQIQEAYEALS